jgi:hypothetical protein
MFGVNWNDPETMWLNLTNLGLGLIVAACFVALGYALLVDVYKRVRGTAGESPLSYERGLDAHALHTPELGLTMADGGEPAEKPAPRRRSPAKK